MRDLARINGLGQITWEDQTKTRVINAGLSIPLGFGLGLLMGLILPSSRASRSTELTLAAVSGGVAAISSMIPVEGNFFDGVSRLSGAFAGASLAHAAVGKGK